MRRIFSPGWLALFLTACAPLETLQEGECGNGVIDTDRNEDCDTFADDNGFACQTEGEWACSYRCSSTGTCPAGYGCGADDICRKPTGTFASSAFVDLPTGAQELMAGDFDADRRADIVGIEPGHLRIYFVGGTGDVQQTSFSSLIRPAVGKLGTVESTSNPSSVDSADDLVLPFDRGIGALISGGDRTFSAKTFSALTFDQEISDGTGFMGRVTDAIPLAIDALPATGTLHAGDEMAAFVALAGKDGTSSPRGAFIAPEAGEQPVFTVEGGTPLNLAGPPVWAPFGEDACPQIALPFRDFDHLSVYTMCVPGKIYGWAHHTDEMAATFARIDLGGAKIAGPVFTFDVNADGHMDLILTTSSDAMPLGLAVAYGLNKGSFSSTPPAAGQTVGDNATSVYAALVLKGSVNGHVPLALGDINGDGYPDLVDSRSVLFGGMGADPPLAFTETYISLRPWDEAILVDVNSNGYPDVVASARDAPDIDILGGNPSMFINPLQLATEGRVAHLTAGDYDGDLVNDIAFEDALPNEGSRLMIAYGRASAGPEEPVQVGAFPSIDRIVSGNVLSFQSDHISDLGVTSEVHEESGNAIALSFLPGSANRFIVPLFYLRPPKSPAYDIPLQTALGLLDSPPPGDDVRNGLAVLAESPLGSETDLASSTGLEKASTALRLWAVRGAGEGEGSTTSAFCSLPGGPFFFPGLEPAISLIVPSSASAIGTAVVAAPYLDVTPGTGFAMSSVLLQLGVPHAGDMPGDNSPPLDCTPGKRWLAPPGQLLVRTKVVDLNGDQKPEILAIAQQYDEKTVIGRLTGEKVEGDDGKPLQPQSSNLLVFWDAFGSGELAPQTAPMPSSMLVSDYAVGDINGDGLPELIVVGSGGRFTFTTQSGGQTLTDSTDLTEDTPDSPKGGPSGPRAVLIADADGDGVNDLALVNEQSSLQIFKGIPRTLIPKDPAADTK